jgi:hypothetical protein
MIVAVILFAVFIAPSAVIGHLVGVTPNLAQIFGKHPGDAWMDAHYPDIVGRFVLVDLVLFSALIGGLVVIGGNASRMLLGWSDTNATTDP